MGFTHLHVHSEYSLLDSTCRLETLVKAAKAKGFTALAITDTNALYGAIPFYKLCKLNDIQPIIGMEITLEQYFVSTENKRKPKTFSLVLLAKNEVGYRNLVKISTKLHTTRHHSMMYKDLSGMTEGLIALSSGPKGEIAELLLNNQADKAKQLALMCKQLFSQFYLELQDHGLRLEKELLMKLVELGKTCEIPFVATNDVHYIESDEARAHLALTCIQSGQTLEDVMTDLNTEYTLKTEAEMVQLFNVYPEAITNTESIAQSCALTFSLNVSRLPKFPLDEGIQADAYLRQLCLKGLTHRYGDSTPQLVDRLDYELSVIHRMGFDDYFLIVWDFVRFARRERITPGPGRGSAAGSLVAYVLGITDVDPIAHHLLFERFLNPERVSMPDIDIDFPDIKRDRVIDYVNQKYGSEHVAQIGTFGTLAAKAAIRDIGRVLKVETRLLDRVAREIPSKPGITLREAYRGSSRLQKLIDDSKDIKEVFRLALQVEGVPRHTSVHAAGIIISEEPLVHLVPLNESRDGLYVTQYPMDVIEELGLLKMDFLGLRNLTLIQRILEIVEQKEHRRIRLETIPLDDTSTFQLLSQAETTGVFQFETNGMRAVLKRLQPTHFEDLVAVNALNRPGPMEFIQDFIDAKHGKRKVHYLHPDLEPILKSTYGIIVYQEQIMQIAAKMAGFSLGEADILRRAVSKKKRDVLEKEEKHFVDGCLAQGYPRETAESIYKLIVRFADYGFNRSHAVAYTVIAYRLAYLKTHEPIAFMTALLSSAIHHQEKLNDYRQEMSRRGLILLGPSINESQDMFTATQEGIRFGLNAIKNVGALAVKEIIEKRQQGQPYTSLFDFCRRVSLRKVNKRMIEALIFAGAFDEFQVDRSSLLASLDTAIQRGESFQGLGGQTSFLNDEEEDIYEQVPPLTLKERLYFEKEVLGFYISAHPLDNYKKIIQSLSVPSLSEVRAENTKKAYQLAVYIEEVKPIRTKAGKQMAFLKMNDPTGVLDGVAFPDAFERIGPLLNKGALLWVKGSVDQKNKEGQPQLILHEAQDLKELKSPSRLFLRIKANHEAKQLLFQLKDALRQYSGPCRVFLFYEDKEQLVELAPKYHVSPSSDCIKKLKDILGEENVILKAPSAV
ncbi:DNA polymerase III subunit alpha [Pullulanibacillus camelliae]|uniref:DNA polymerase III subunit alpha n=1 Tax=Pullulanibacillus camelliae TaxID=1707096 RepID=A0A8J2YMD2_9BACL|nr:DNA polymerase III subunit alpha [Pullulanibacillus camelliae]GGE52059.1 DNA polymerase III subunit alpha [Pullulanibacillus camelliae]